MAKPFDLTPQRVAERIKASGLGERPHEIAYKNGVELGRLWATHRASFTELETMVAAQPDAKDWNYEDTSLGDFAQHTGWTWPPEGGEQGIGYLDGIMEGAYEVWSAVYDYL